jgi:hypothetical protein
MIENASWQSANTPDVLQRILADACGVSISSWRRRGTGYFTTAHGGLKIGRVNGIWLAKDYSTATLGDNIGRTPKSLLFHVYNLRTTQEAAEKLAVLTGVKVGNNEGVAYQRTDHGLRPQSLGFYHPNTNSTRAAPKKHFDHVDYGNWDTAYGQVVLHYIRHKTKADFATIKQFCRPITRTSQSERVKNYDEDHFAYAVFEGLHVRIFRPYLKYRGIDKMPLQSVGNYVFGFSNLPDAKKDCAVLFIVGGEHDCIAFNHAYNRFGWYAVTQGSETRNLSKELVALLRKRCKRLVTFFDNDLAGGNGMDKQAREHGLQGIDLGSFVNNKDVFTHDTFDVKGRNRMLNDICDVLNTEGGTFTLKKMIDRELTTKRVVQSSPYRPTFSSVFYTLINNYLCDTEGSYLQLKNQIYLNPKLVLQSPTGTGKTYLMLCRFANDPAFFKQLGIERIVYLCPTNALGQQQADKHKIPFLTSLRKEDASEVTQSRVIAATFDQVSKMPQFWQDTSLIIVDEFDTLTSEFSYRAKTMRCLLKFLQSSKHVLGITATPNLAFIKYANYSLCVAEFENVAQAQNINVHPILLEKGGAKDVLTDIERRRDADCVTVLKFDDFELLRSYEKILVEKYGASAVTLISSKEDATSVNNAHYQSLMKTDRVGEEIQFVLCTKILEAGVNFEFPAEIFYIFPQATSSLLQAFARPRIDRENRVNLAVNAFVYIAKGTYRNKTKLAELATRFTAFTNGEAYELPTTLNDHSYNLQSAIKNHQKLCDAFNAFPKAKGHDTLLKMNDFPVFLNPDTKTYEVDVLRIFSEKEAELQGILRGDVVAFFAELKSVNPHVTIQPLEIISLDKDDAVRNVLTASRAEAITQKTVIASYFTEHTTKAAALTVAYFDAKNTETRLKIETQLGRKPLPHEAENARQRLGETGQGQNAVLSVVSPYLELVELARHVKYANGVQPIKAADIERKLPEILRGYDLFTNQLERLAQRLTDDREKTMTRENAPVIFAGRVSNALRDEVFKYRADRRVFSTSDLFRLYNTAVQKATESLCMKIHYTERDFKVVLRRFEALFDVDCSEKNRYRIGAEITAKNIFDCHGSEENELTTMTNEEA